MSKVGLAGAGAVLLVGGFALGITVGSKSSDPTSPDKSNVQVKELEVGSATINFYNDEKGCEYIITTTPVYGGSANSIEPRMELGESNQRQQVCHKVK
ncbi:hypothetical protein CEW46_26950 [Bacillus cereus]|nr:hypothetical protein CEW46_26950 [Bacillus cereus]